MSRLEARQWLLASLMGFAACGGTVGCDGNRPPAGTAVSGISSFFQDPNPSTYQPLPGGVVLLTDATVLDGAGNRLNGVDVLLRDGKISEVAENLQVPESAVVVDASGRWVTPGIIDVHSHDGTYLLPLTSQDFAISDLSEISEPNAAEIWIEHGINAQDFAFRRALASGVTTLQVLPGSVPLIGGRSVVLKNVPATTVYGMKFPGAQQGVKMACGENPKSHFGESGDAPTSRMGEISLLREAFLKAQVYQQEWLAYWQHPAGVQPPERDLTLETLAGVLNGDFRVHVHCYKADDMAVILGVAREFGFRIDAFHHAVEAYKITGLLEDNQVCAAIWSDWWGYKLEATDAIRENAALLESAGVCTIMHSDSPVTGQRLNMEAAKSIGAGRRAGIEIAPEQAIRWLTSNPAITLGLEDQIGQVKAGLNADIVVWSGNPFSIYSHADQVFIDGALVFDRFDKSHQPVSDSELAFPITEVSP